MSVPSKFTGFTLSSPENWDKPKVQQYEAKPEKSHDVTIKIQVCSVCGTDHHIGSGGWGPYGRDDLVVGHEIVGTVVKVGAEVKEFAVGDVVGVGAQSNSCGECDLCLNDNEQYCEKSVLTYNQADMFSDGYVTQGGFANYTRVTEKHVFRVPDGMSAEVAAPFFCGGITVFSPLVRNLTPYSKQKVGIIGIGGLGHFALQFANKFGWEVVAFSRSSKKQQEAAELGAHHFVATGEDSDWVSKHSNSFDLIINCATSFSAIDLNQFIDVVKPGCKLIGVGLPDFHENITVNALKLGMSGKFMGGSIIGNKKEVKQMLDFAVKNDIKPWTEVFSINEDNYKKALTKISKSDAHYRVVLTDFDKFFNKLA